MIEDDVSLGFLCVLGCDVLRICVSNLQILAASTALGVDMAVIFADLSQASKMMLC